MLRVGLIGLGGVGQVHLQAYRQAEKVNVIAAADIAYERVKPLTDAYEVKLYRDYCEMIASEALDIVCILTPVGAHEDIVTQCANRGLNIMCEKPLTLTLESAARMAEICAKQKVKFLYGSTYRFLPAVTTAKRLIEAGEIGDVRLMREEMIGGEGATSYQPMSYHHYPECGPGGSGMGLVDHGVHLIDIFSWLSGSEIVDVTGTANISGQPPVVETMDMKFKTGCKGLLTYYDSTFSTAAPNDGIFSEGEAWMLSGGLSPANTWQTEAPSFHVYGTRGALRVYYYGNHVTLKNEDGLRRVPVNGPAPPAHFATQIDAFAKSILADTDSPTPIECGIKALRALLAVYEAQSSGRRVSVASS